MLNLLISKTSKAILPLALALAVVAPSTFAEAKSAWTPEQTARFLSGYGSMSSNPATIEATPIYREFSLSLQKDWDRQVNPRLESMYLWSQQEIVRAAPHCETLFYPFGGPDIVHAETLFPHCHSYFLFGIEPIGSLPKVSELNLDEQKDLLSAVTKSLNEIFGMGYFITFRMLDNQKKSALNGNVPTMALQLSLLGAQIHSIQSVFINKQGFIGTTGSVQAGDIPGAKIRYKIFYNNQWLSKEVYYFSLDFSDANLQRNPQFFRAMSQKFSKDAMRPLSFVKAASYLMHNESNRLQSGEINHSWNFTRIRDFVLNESRLILQDDSGIPIPHVLRSKMYDIKLYGDYKDPVKDFDYLKESPNLQALKSAVSVEKSKGTLGDLPFPYGYNRNRATVMRLIRKD